MSACSATAAASGDSSIVREKTPERLVHVGYNVTLSEEVLRLVQKLFPASVVPSTLTIGPYITAVLHVNQDATQEQLHSWYKKAAKNTEDQARVRSIFYHCTISRDKKTNVAKSCRAIVALYITVGGSHLYLNVFNNVGLPPFKVKQAICAGSFTEKKLPTPLPVTAAAYKAE